MHRKPRILLEIFPVRDVIVKEQQHRHRFSQTLSDTLDISDEEFVSDRIDDTTNDAIDQIVNEDMNQLGAKQCDIVSSFESSRTVSDTSELEPSQKESLSDVYRVEIVHELYRLCMDWSPRNAIVSGYLTRRIAVYGGVLACFQAHFLNKTLGTGRRRHFDYKMWIPKVGNCITH